MIWPFKKKRKVPEPPGPPPPPTVTVYLQRQDLHDALADHAYNLLNVADQNNALRWNCVLTYHPKERFFSAEITFELEKSSRRPRLTVVE